MDLNLRYSFLTKGTTMETFNIAILDDSKSKVDTIRVLFMQQSDRAEKCYDGRYSDYNLQLKPINIEKSCDQIIDEIISSKFDAIIIDYHLDSSGIISDNGITIATRIKERFSEYPLFILTAYEDSLFRNEVFDAYQVYNYENYVNNVTATKEFHCHIIEQILKSRKQIEIWELELASLLKIPEEERTADIVSKIIDLDNKIEKSIDGTSCLPAKTKSDLSSNKLSELLKQADELLKET